MLAHSRPRDAEVGREWCHQPATEWCLRQRLAEKPSHDGRGLRADEAKRISAATVQRRKGEIKWNRRGPEPRKQKGEAGTDSKASDQCWRHCSTAGSGRTARNRSGATNSLMCASHVSAIPQHAATTARTT